MVDGDLAAQTHRVFKNLGAILEAAGASFDNVVRTTVYLADMNDFPAMNEIYGDVLLVARPGARHRAGGTAAARRARRNRSDRFAVAPRSSEPHKSAHIDRGMLQSSAELEPSVTARSTSTTPSTDLSDLITFCRCFTSLISTVMSMRPICESTVASTLRMLVLMPAIFELTSARMPFRSSTWMLSRTV